MPQQSILVIDDEIIWHKLLRRLLGAMGYTVYTAATCAAGIKLAKRHRPDCILLDFHLPDDNAISACSALRADKNTVKIPVIIFSSDPDVEITVYGECKANYFVLKGMRSLTDLPAAIRSVLPPVSPPQTGGYSAGETRPI